MFLTKPRRALVIILMACVLSGGVLLLARLTPATGQAPAKHNDPSTPPAKEASKWPGEWLLEGKEDQACAIFQQGRVLLLVNEKGDISNGKITGDNQVVAWGDLGGELDDKGKTISWGNGTTWKRATLPAKEASKWPGEWLLGAEADQPCAIFQQGRVLLLVNEKGDTSNGKITGDNQIVAWGDLGGELDDKGKTISWGNGTTWKRATLPAKGASKWPGEWLLGAEVDQACAIFQQGRVLLLVNEKGDISNGKITGDNQVVAWGDLGGELDDKGKTISWGNGTTWRRASPSPGATATRPPLDLPDLPEPKKPDLRKPPEGKLPSPKELPTDLKK